ncbi:MAG: SprB repeat-containing protein, partial [Bacteroidales bacterium]|nr:SprB repeat-containing protein [Bacteroidales bacterium]
MNIITFMHNVLPGKNFAILFLWLLIATKGINQVVPVVSPTGGFHIDGDLKANTPTSGVGDWLMSPGTGGFVLTNAGIPLDTLKTILIKDPFNSNDQIFQSSKFNDNPNGWNWVIGTANNKSDINNVMLHIATDINNNTWLIVASDRLSTNGTSYIDFEFFQNTLVKNNNGTFTSSGPHQGRTVNDFVLSMEYSNGGSNAIVRFYRWQLVGSSYNYVQVAIPGTAAFAKTNITNVPVDFGAFGSTTYTSYQFVEGAINLTQLFGSFDACLGLNIKTVVVKTKASTSQTSSLIDFAEPIQTQLYLNTSSISYPANLCNSGTTTPIIHGVQGGTFSASSPNVNINTSTGQINLTNSIPGTYTITYHYQVNGCPKTASTTITIQSLPTPPSSIISSDNNICSTYNNPITLTANGGSGSVLKWFTGSCGGTQIGTGTTLSIAPPTSTTTYFARWENQCGVSSCASITITVFNNVSATVSYTPQVSCHNGTNGQIIVLASGGTPPYSYCLNNGIPQNSNVFNNLPSGNYFVQVYDANGCQTTVSNIQIQNPSLLTATVSSSSQVSCHNGSDGQIVVTAQGGTG